MSRRLRRTTWLSLLTLAACAGGPGDITIPAAEPSSGATGILAGRVTRGPAGPVEGLPGQAGPPPVPGMRVVVVRLDGRAAGSATTDSRGEYRIALPAGTYEVTVGALRPGEFVKGLPATVTVHPGTESRFDILIDTGVR